MQRCIIVQAHPLWFSSSHEHVVVACHSKAKTGQANESVVLDILVVAVLVLLEAGLLVLDGHVGAGAALPLASDEVGDLLVLGLLDGGLVVLRSSAHESLLDKVDA